MEAGSWVLEVGSWKASVVRWKVVVGTQKLALGGWRVEVGSGRRRSDDERCRLDVVLLDFGRIVLRTMACQIIVGRCSSHITMRLGCSACRFRSVNGLCSHSLHRRSCGLNSHGCVGIRHLSFGEFEVGWCTLALGSWSFVKLEARVVEVGSWRLDGGG